MSLDDLSEHMDYMEMVSNGAPVDEDIVYKNHFKGRAKPAVKPYVRPIPYVKPDFMSTKSADYYRQLREIESLANTNEHREATKEIREILASDISDKQVAAQVLSWSAVYPDHPFSADMSSYGARLDADPS